MGQANCNQCLADKTNSVSFKHSHSTQKISYTQNKLLSSITNLGNARSSLKEIHYQISFETRHQALLLFRSINSQTHDYKCLHTLKIKSCDIQQTKSIKPSCEKIFESYIVRIQFERALPFVQYANQVKKTCDQRLIWKALKSVCEMACKFNPVEFYQIFCPENIFIVTEKGEEIWKLIEARLFFKNKKIHQLLANGLNCNHIYSSIMKKICISLISLLTTKNINSKKQLIKILSPMSLQITMSTQLKNLLLSMLEGLITFKGVIKKTQQFLFKIQNSCFLKNNRKESNNTEISLGSTLKINWKNRQYNLPQQNYSTNCKKDIEEEISDIALNRIRNKIAVLKSGTHNIQPFSSKFIQYPQNHENKENKDFNNEYSDIRYKSTPCLLNLAALKLPNCNQLLSTDRKDIEEDQNNKIISTRVTQNDQRVKTIQKNSEIYIQQQLLDETPQQTNKKNYDSQSMLLTQNIRSNDKKALNKDEICSEFQQSQRRRDFNQSQQVKHKRIDSILISQDNTKDMNWNWMNRELLQKVNTQKSYEDQSQQASIIDYGQFELQNKCNYLLKKNQLTYQLEQSSYLKPQAVNIKECNFKQNQQQNQKENDGLLSSIKSQNAIANSNDQIQFDNQQSIQRSLQSEQTRKQQISPLSPVQQYEKYKDLNDDSISYFIQENPMYCNQTIYEQSNQEDISSNKHTQIKNKLISSKNSEQDKQSISQIIRQLQIDANNTINRMTGLRVSRAMLSSCSNTHTIYQNSEFSSEKVSSYLSKSYRIISQQSQFYQGYVRRIQTEEGEQLIREGTGKNVYPDGTIYQGQWLNNQPDGFGKLINCIGQLLYEGYWKDGKYHGKGKLYNPNPQTQEVNQKNNNRIAFNDYIYYEGNFLEGQMHGKGLLHFQQFIFQGKFGESQKICGILYLENQKKQGEFRRQHFSGKLEFYEKN